MIKYFLPKIEFLAPFIHNVFTKRNLIILLGINRSLLLAVNNNKIVGQLYISEENYNAVAAYQYFFNKFKKYNIFFLLDDRITTKRHELIPLIQSIVKTDPVENFIKEHFTSDQIVAYNVHSIIQDQGEIWKTIIVSMPFASILPIMDYILSSSLKFGGIYFLALEFITIINHILVNNRKQYECANHLQIFVTTTQVYDIKIVVKHNSNILNIQTFEYPTTKGEVYIQGIIEQLVSDHLLKFKNYIQERNLNVCLILLTSPTLKTLLAQSNFPSCTVLCVTDVELLKKSLNSTDIQNSDKFSDITICSIFSEYKNFIGLNQPLKTFTRLSLINTILFKPLIIITLLLLFNVLSIKFISWQKNLDTHNLNKQYHLIANEYRNLKQKYPDIKNLINFADLYSLEALLQIPLPLPFNLADKLFTSLTPEIQLQKFTWRLLEPNNLLNKGKKELIEAEIEYNIPKVAGKASNSSAEELIKKLQANLPDYKLQVTNIDNSNKLLPLFVTPISITIRDEIK